MKLPHASEALIASEKLRDYLLSPEHPVGRYKASFFNGLGYTREQWQLLEADLRSQHLTMDAEERESSAHGRKFVINGPLAGPSGTARVLSVWVIRHGEDVPRFVTAYPGGS